MSHPEVKVTLLDGSTREFNSWNDYYNIANTLTLHSYNDKPAYIDCYNDGSISYQEWYLNNKEYTEEDYKAYLKEIDQLPLVLQLTHEEEWVVERAKRRRQVA